MESNKQKRDSISSAPDEPREPVHEAVEQETASPERRGYRAWIFQFYVLGSLIGFAALAIFVSQFQVSNTDIALTRELQAESPAWFGALLVWVSWLGYAVQSIVITVALVVTIYLLGLRWEAKIAALASVAAWSINFLVKIAIRRPRPTVDLVEVFAHLDSYSFPSGHVMYYTVFFGFLAFLSFTLLKRLWLRVLLAAFFGSLVVLVGPSRVYLGEHWTSDVIAAYLLGFLILWAVIYIYRSGKNRLSSKQPVAPTSIEKT